MRSIGCPYSMSTTTKDVAICLCSKDEDAVTQCPFNSAFEVECCRLRREADKDV